MSPESAFATFAAFFCLCRSSFGLENGQTVDRVFVKEGSDVVLPCSPGNQDLRPAIFEWKKDAQKVFLYYRGKHYNNGHDGQDPQFKCRVSHLEDELQYGNASIIIQNTKLEDSGNYTCGFDRLDPPQTFDVELVVGVAAMPYVRTVNATDAWSLLQCDVRGAFPKPKVEWKNSDGEVLHSQDPHFTESEGRYHVTLPITVNQTGLYRCVVTQEELHHQIHEETFVHVSGIKKCASDNSYWGWLILAFVLGGFAVAAALWIWPVLTKHCPCGSSDSTSVSKVEDDAVLLSSRGLFLDHAEKRRSNPFYKSRPESSLECTVELEKHQHELM